LGNLEFVGTQQDREDGLDLHGGKRRPRTLAEDLRHEQVGLSLIEILISGPKEELAGLRTRQQNDLLVRQMENTEVTALLADAVHQRDRIRPNLLEVSVLFLATGNTGHDCGGHCPGIPCSPRASL